MNLEEDRIFGLLEGRGSMVISNFSSEAASRSMATASFYQFVDKSSTNLHQTCTKSVAPIPSKIRTNEFSHRANNKWFIMVRGPCTTMNHFGGVVYHDQSWYNPSRVSFASWY
ncbi:hypothetical protein K439DRAFT_1567357 [Ramaria rubella]|nr:hypothetical protein K439DRAFT_1567357 [Ramaria rubella]